jgi:hypothetical protein
VPRPFTAKRARERIGSRPMRVRVSDPSLLSDLCNYLSLRGGRGERGRGQHSHSLAHRAASRRRRCSWRRSTSAEPSGQGSRSRLIHDAQAALRRISFSAIAAAWLRESPVGDETLFVLRHSPTMRESQHRRSCWLWRAPRSCRLPTRMALALDAPPSSDENGQPPTSP